MIISEETGRALVRALDRVAEVGERLLAEAGPKATTLAALAKQYGMTSGKLKDLLIEKGVLDKRLKSSWASKIMIPASVAREVARLMADRPIHHAIAPDGRASLANGDG